MSARCTACPVYVGECPRCGTFWFDRGDGKRWGVERIAPRPPIVIQGPQNTTVTVPPNPGYCPYDFADLPNVVKPRADGLGVIEGSEATP